MKKIPSDGEGMSQRSFLKKRVAESRRSNDNHDDISQGRTFLLLPLLPNPFPFWRNPKCSQKVRSEKEEEGKHPLFLCPLQVSQLREGLIWAKENF